MFGFLERNKKVDNIIMSPVNGMCIELSEVPDKVFAEKVMGDGVAFIIEDDMLYSPCYGSIAVITPTLHAIGIKSDCGAEILIHVGMDTVELNGEGFEVLVKVNQKVKVGTPLLKFNRAFMDEKSINLITPLVITNSNDYELELQNVGQPVENGKSQVIKCIRK